MEIIWVKISLNHPSHGYNLSQATTYMPRNSAKAFSLSTATILEHEAANFYFSEARSMLPHVLEQGGGVKADYLCHKGHLSEAIPRYEATHSVPLRFHFDLEHRFELRLFCQEL